MCEVFPYSTAQIPGNQPARGCRRQERPKLAGLRSLNRRLRRREIRESELRMGVIVSELLTSKEAYAWVACCDRSIDDVHALDTVHEDSDRIVDDLSR